MNAIDTTTLSRRAFLTASGALVVALMTPAELAAAESPNGAATRPPVMPTKLSSFITIEPDGTVVGYYGKIDGGQGLETSISQMIAEEIEVPWERVRLVMGDTAETVDMGGASAASGMRVGGMIMRRTAAEARRLMIEMAAKALNTAPNDLTVTDGVVHEKADPSKKITYAKLIGGRYFDSPVGWNGVLGSQLNIKVEAPLKKPADFKVIGKSYPRRDMPGKVFGTLEQCADVRLPNMVHARVIRPPQAGSVPLTVDEKSVANISGAQVVHIKDFLAVVAEKEWNAIRAAKALKVTWSPGTANFPGHEGLFDYIRGAPVVARSSPTDQGASAERVNGSVEDGFRQAVRVIEAEYQYPFQSHASMGPAVGVADVKDGGATIWTSSQKPHDCAAGIAELLQLPADKVHVVWKFGTCSFSRNDQGDAVGDAAVLSKHLGRPVRVQYMRYEALAWSPKGPAEITLCRAGFDAAGKVIAYEHVSKGFSMDDCSSRERHPGDMLAGQLLGAPLNSVSLLGIPANAYVFDNMRIRWETIAPLMDRMSPLRTTHLHDPYGVTHLFGMESFIDEMAVAADIDPIEFRLRTLQKDREHEVLRAAAKQYGWDTRPSPRDGQAKGDVAMGRGIAYRQLHDTYLAIIAEVRVHRTTGAIEVTRVVCAHDCGPIVNPATLEHMIDAQIHWQLGRTLFEEMQFDDKMALGVDWLTYPVLKMASAPKVMEIVLINRPEMAVSGAGAHALGAVPGAISNAVFDATGVRLRRVPFTPERVSTALNNATSGVEAKKASL